MGNLIGLGGDMVFKARFANGATFANLPTRLRRSLLARRTRVAALASLCLGALTALHGTAGTLSSLRFSLPEGWAIGVVAFRLLARGTIQRGRVSAARWLFWTSWPALCLQQVQLGLDGQRFDALLLTGWLALLIGLELARSAPDRLRGALRRLTDRELLGVSPEAADATREEVERTGDRWAVVGGVVVAALQVVTWPRWEDVPSEWDSWRFGPLVADEVMFVLAAAIVGGWLGRMTGFGRLGRVLTRREIRPRVVPGHPDGAGGLRPLGDLYLYQSLVASQPAVYLALLVVVVSLGGRNPGIDYYHPFLGQYLWLLTLAIMFEILIFVAPMYSLHRMMKRQKEDVSLPEADRLSTIIEDVRARLGDATSDERDRDERLLTRLLERHTSLEDAPTWPIDPSIRRRFALRNASFLAPFAGYLIGPTGFWEWVSDRFNLG